MIEEYPKKLSSVKNKRIISIGRIVEGKRIDEIVEIASKVDKSWEFIIIGDGDKSLHILIEDIEGRHVAVYIEELTSSHIPRLVHSDVYAL